VEALITAGADVDTSIKAPLPGYFTVNPLYLAVKYGLVEFFSLLPPELARARGFGMNAALAFLRKKERAARRQELLACVANARREQDAGRGEGLHPLLDEIANLPPEVVRCYIIPNYR
jgi:hypothetical protein